MPREFLRNEVLPTLGVAPNSWNDCSGWLTLVNGLTSRPGRRSHDQSRVHQAQDSGQPRSTRTTKQFTLWSALWSYPAGPSRNRTHASRCHRPHESEIISRCTKRRLACLPRCLTWVTLRMRVQAKMACPLTLQELTLWLAHRSLTFVSRLTMTAWVIRSLGRRDGVKSASFRPRARRRAPGDGSLRCEFALELGLFRQ